MGILSKRSNKYWSGRAPEFSGLRMNEYESPMRNAYEKFLLEILPDSKKDLKVLDVGTGAGFFALILNKLGCQVTAVHFSSEMLVQAKKNAEEKGIKDIVFLQMDAQNLTFPDNTFDFIITRNVTWIVEDAKKMYYHIHRVLKPGGIMVNIDANYGKTFKESDERGEKLVSTTQTIEQQRERNDISEECYITEKRRPSWDVDVLIDLGVSDLRVHLDFNKKLELTGVNPSFTNGLKKDKSHKFAVVAKK
jgi:SAM-dependent methyltransferase